MPDRNEFIIDAWERQGNDAIGAPEIDVVQQELAEHFGTVSPAVIARIVADEGGRLVHPEVLLADVQWRERRQLFSPEELTFGTIEGATGLMEKIQRLPFDEGLRQAVREIKAELELVTGSRTVSQNLRELAGEVVQWLAIWLQNPQIFAEWLVLRRSTAEFRERFGR
jgi:hypothetical protein